MALSLGIRGRHEVKTQDNMGVAFYSDIMRDRSYRIEENFGEAFDLANSV